MGGKTVEAAVGVRDDEADRRSLRALAGWAFVLSIPLVVGELVVWMVFSQSPLLTAFIIHGSVTLGFLAVRQIAATGRVAVAAHLMGYLALGGTAAGSVLVHLGTHLQVLIPALAVAIVLPYLSGRGLFTFFGVALVMQVGFGLQSLIFPAHEVAPGIAQALLELGAILAAFCLSLVVLRQFSTRLRGMVRQAEDATARASQIATENLRLYTEAAEAVRVRDEFLSVASHELKTPLTPIHLQLQLLLRLAQRQNGQPLTSEQLLPRLQGLIRTTVRLEQLVDRLLDLSHVSSGRIALNPEPVDVVSVTRRVVAELEPVVEGFGCAVQLQAPQSAVGRWDQQALEHIFVNLIANAAKFGASKPIDVTVQAQPESVVITVQDHGIGIAPQDQERIFGRFERAVSPRHYGGLGLGLWIVQRTVEAMGGSIRLESAPGTGAKFIVRLPTEPGAQLPLGT